MARNLFILKEHMERLEFSLEDADLVKFSLKLLQSKVISKDVKDKFDYLDSDHLESDIKVRYLLQQVCERVREDDKVYDRLVRVLGSSDLYGTGRRILLMIISNNLRVYNTRVRSDCKSEKVILKNSRFLYLGWVDIIDARALQHGKGGKVVKLKRCLC